MYYAETYGQSIEEDVYEGGFLRYEKDSEPYCDLFRFETKKERDTFVEESNAKTITAKEAKIKHREQFLYWNNL
jgi:hypothetical protein